MQSLAEEKQVTSSAYGMYSYSIRNELTRKYYERRLKTFFDYIGFEVHADLETRCNLFAMRGRSRRKMGSKPNYLFLAVREGPSTEG